jgi:uncharacterized protein YndB with AHSA1/START domain
MTASGSVPPLVVEFDVAAPPEHAFDIWVNRAHLWWPAGHTLSGNPTAIVFEPRHGGRIFERGPNGEEQAWGEVLDWQPPARLRCLWHLLFSRDEATEVEITFTAAADGTRVRLTQTGWDALGAEGPARRERTVQGWANVTTRYRRMADEGEHNPTGGE